MTGMPAMIEEISTFAVAKAYQLGVNEMEKNSQLADKLIHLEQKMSRVEG